MAEEDDKQYEATQRKLDDARRKGQVPHSADLTTAAAYGGLLAALALSGPMILTFAARLRWFLDPPGDEAEMPLALPVSTALAALIPVALLPMAAVLASVLAQRGLVFAPEKLAPRLSRISPVQNFRQKFGRDGLFNFSKSAVKLIVFAAILTWFVSSRLIEILTMTRLDVAESTALMSDLALRFLATVVGVAVLIGLVDLLWQRSEHARRNRMSRKELMDESKESEGDPHLRQRRRQRAMEIATNRMLTEVPKADVVIVNPSHYAVALKWDRARPVAPICVAKGTDAVAARIREAASAAGVPIRRDPPAARAIHATVDLGQPILPEHFRAVAAAIRFADTMRRRARVPRP